MGTAVVSNQNKIFVKICEDFYFAGQIVSIIMVFIVVTQSPSVVQLKKKLLERCNILMYNIFIAIYSINRSSVVFYKVYSTYISESCIL